MVKFADLFKIKNEEIYMKTRLAFFLKNNQYNDSQDERKYICEVYYEDSYHTDSQGKFHKEIKNYIYRNTSPEPRILTFSICYDSVESGNSTTITIGFNNSESLNKFIEKCPSDIQILLRQGGALCYADPSLTYQISIQEDAPNAKEILKNAINLMQELDPFDKSTIDGISSRFKITGCNQFEEQIKNRLIHAYVKGAMMGLFAQTNNLPPELGAEVAKYLNGKDGGNVALTSKLALETAEQEYDKEEKNIKINKP